MQDYTETAYELGFPRGRLDEFDSYALILYGKEK